MGKRGVIPDGSLKPNSRDIERQSEPPIFGFLW